MMDVKRTFDEQLMKIGNKTKVIFGSVFVWGIIAHLYMYTNRIVNHDSVFSTHYSGSTFTSGRWFLGILSEIVYLFDGNYVAPWKIGFLSIVLYSLVVYVLIKILEIEQLWACMIISGMVIVFPTITSNNLYIFTAHYYALALLLSCLSVYLLIQKQSVINIVGSGCLLALSLGIYQGYLPFIITTYSVIIMLECMNKNVEIIELCKKIGIYLLSGSLGICVYLVVNKIFLTILGLEMDTYLGMNQMGEISLDKVVVYIKKSYEGIFKLFLSDYCGLNHKAWLKMVFLGCCFFVIICVILYIAQHRDRGKTNILLVIVLIALPLALGFIHMMCQEEKGINTMTVFSNVYILLLPIILVDRIEVFQLFKGTIILQKISFFVSILVILYYSNVANETYVALEYSNRNVNAYFTQLVTQIKMLDGYSNDLKVAFVGDVNDESLPDINYEYIIRGTYPTSELINLYSREFFVTMHCGYICEFIEDTETIKKDKRVEEMPVYPAKGGVKIIDDMIVVKFSE